MGHGEASISQRFESFPEASDRIRPFMLIEALRRLDAVLLLGPRQADLSPVHSVHGLSSLFLACFLAFWFFGSVYFFTGGLQKQCFSLPYQE